MVIGKAVPDTARHRRNQSAAARLRTNTIRQASTAITCYMRITIESLNYEAVRQFGFTPMAGYRVIFTAGPLRAGAWFVPATEDVSILVGQSFEVEVNQERISDLVLVPPSESASNTFSAMPEFACFQVRGQVASAHPRNKDGGDPIAFVSAGDAYITLGDDELAGLELKEGDTVAFLMHDVSLWDSAI